MSRRLDQLHADLSRDLDRIARRFVGQPKLTLVVRDPDVPGDADVVVTNDTPEAAVEAIRKRFADSRCTCPWTAPVDAPVRRVLAEDCPMHARKEPHD